MKYDDLTDAQKKEAHSAINSAWRAIAGDIFSCRADGGETGPMPQDEVIEVTLDADYIDMYGDIKDPVVKKFFDEYKGDSYEQQIKAAKVALPHKTWVL